MSSFDLRFPSDRTLNKTTSSGFSYLSNHQQRAPALTGPLVYNSLPRLKTANKNGTSSLPQARRKLVNNALQNYLKSLNAMTRSIVLETASVEKEHQCDWTKMDEAKKENIMNEHFVPSEVRLQYESERASSSCSFHSFEFTSHQDNLMVQNSPTHLSQCSSNWEEPAGVSYRSKNVIYTNKWSRTASDMSLSQPLVSSAAESVQPSKFDRLHKNQLSFRSNHKHATKPRYMSPHKHILPSHQLGSDGESQRNSDEDYESNPLGFQRNKLRSFSMRSKRAGGATKNSANFRSSARTTNKIRTSADGDESSDVESYRQHCRPSHYHKYSTNINFDEEIDVPDDTLLLDHVPRKISTDETDSNASFQLSSNNTDHYRTRGSCRATKIAMDMIHKANSFLEEDAGLSANEDSSSTFLAESQDSSFFRSQSRESSDIDSMSMAASDISKYDEESTLDFMPIPGSISFSTHSSHSKSKSSEMAVFRNSKGKRGGSHFRVATSDFADRHTQFKTNMLQRNHFDSSSVITTRPSSPSSSVASSILYSSVAESTTSDLPHFPSTLSCSPSTPLAVSYTQHNQILRKGISSGCQEHRESGYISSSSDSIPVATHR